MSNVTQVRVEWGRGRDLGMQRDEGTGDLEWGVGSFKGCVIGRVAQNRLLGPCEPANVGGALECVPAQTLPVWNLNMNNTVAPSAINMFYVNALYQQMMAHDASCIDILSNVQCFDLHA